MEGFAKEWRCRFCRCPAPSPPLPPPGPPPLPPVVVVVAAAVAAAVHVVIVPSQRFEVVMGQQKGSSQRLESNCCLNEFSPLQTSSHVHN